MRTDLADLEKKVLEDLLGSFDRSGRFETGSGLRHESSLLSSCWQKAIRRGDSELAVKCSLSLHERNAEYVWRRIRGIALEEVSICDMSLVSQVLAIAGKRSLQKRVGERRLLASLTARLAIATKCRTPCDLLMWLPITESNVKAEHSHIDTATVRALRQTAATWKSTASISARGPGGWVTISRGDPSTRDQLLDAVDAPPLVRFIAKRGAGTDGLNVLLAPTYLHASETWSPQISDAPHAASSEDVNGLPAYAYCLFSKPGRQALQQVLRSERKLIDRFNSLGIHDGLRALGHLVFQAEGGYCSEIADFYLSTQIRKLSEEFSLARFGVPSAAAGELVLVVSELLPRINEYRRRI